MYYRVLQFWYSLLVLQLQIVLSSSLVDIHQSHFNNTIQKTARSSICEACSSLHQFVRNTEPIQDDGSDILYFIEMEFGLDHNNTEFRLVVDTGSFDLWVYSSSCTNSSCISHRRLSRDHDNIEVLSDTNFSITYGQGSVSGAVAKGFVRFSDYTLAMLFGLAQNVDDSFTSFPVDGIMGLGATTRQSTGYDGVVSALKKQNKIQHGVVGIELEPAYGGSGSGSISFGDVDTSRFEGNITFVDLMSDTDMWVIPMEECYVRGVSLLLENRTALLDTGTTLNILPKHDALLIHLELVESNGTLYTDGTNYIIPCDTNSTLEIAIGTKLWNIPPSGYIRSNYSNLGCLTSIQGGDILGNSTWLLGSAFLKGVYSVFDLEDRRIGLANLGSNGINPYKRLPSINFTSQLFCKIRRWW
ncbi:aspartic peptidase domain-containing protein [Dipodascopsis uninucleata]